MKFCNKCGTELLPEAIFCSKCGVQVKEIKKEKRGVTAKVIEEAIKDASFKKERGVSPEKVREERGIERVETKYITRGISKNIFYPVLIILVIGLITVSCYLNHYINEFNDMEKLRYQQKLETEKYKSMYQQEAGIKQQEIQKRQEAEAETSQTQSELYSEQQRLNEIQIKLSSTQTELEQAQEQMSAVETEVQEIYSNLNNLEYWVTENSKLTSAMLNNIHRYCGSYISESDGSCIINAPKMGSDMSGCLGFTWVDDTVTANVDIENFQRVFDVDTFWQSKEGDCDDFGMFFAAWLRSEYEVAKVMCSESNIYVLLKEGDFLSDPVYIDCPCDFYVVGGCYKEGDTCHMETGIGTPRNVYSDSSFLNNMHVIEPQGGGYDGYATINFEGGVNWVFTTNDFLTIYDNQIVSCLKTARDKLQEISI